MTVETMRGRGQRRFDFVRMTAPALMLVCIAVALSADTPAQQVSALGQALSMAVLSIYVFHLRGRPIPQRPPVRFTPAVLGLIGLFCLGTILAGAGMVLAGGALFGGLMMVGPSVLAVLLAVYLRSPSGRRYRERLAAS